MNRTCFGGVGGTVRCTLASASASFEAGATSCGLSEKGKLLLLLGEKTVTTSPTIGKRLAHLSTVQKFRKIHLNPQKKGHLLQCDVHINSRVQAAVLGKICICCVKALTVKTRYRVTNAAGAETAI